MFYKLQEMRPISPHAAPELCQSSAHYTTISARMLPSYSLQFSLQWKYFLQILFRLVSFKSTEFPSGHVLVDEKAVFQVLQGNMILFLYLFPLEFKNKCGQHLYDRF